MESYRIQEQPHDTPDPFGGMTIAEMKALDTYSEETLERVDTTYAKTGVSAAKPVESYTFTTETGSGLSISRNRCGDKIDAIKPKVGSTIRIYPGGLGSRFHGVDIDGVEAFWQTPLERDAQRVEWLADYDRRQREEFAERKGKLDAAYEALPDPLKARIDRFRDRSPSFRVESESYEMFCCAEGAKFAERAQTIAGRVKKSHGKQAGDVVAFFSQPERKTGDKVWDVAMPDDPAEAWLLWAWSLEDYKRQSKLLGSSDDHSGNTFGGAMMLALALLRGHPC